MHKDLEKQRAFQTQFGKREWEEFEKYNKQWAEIQKEFEIWLVDIRNQLENPGLANGEGLDVRELDRLGGNAEGIRKAYNIVSFMINAIENLEVENAD